MPVLAETLRDASLYAGLAVLLAALSLFAPAERRRPAIMVALLALAMLAGLWLLGRFGGRFDDRTMFEIAREALLALLAVAVFRAVLHFATRVVLARFAIPSIVSDVLLGLGLVAYALVRLTAVGVNLAGIVTTSAVITGAIAFSAQEVLGALWAGLALQIDRTLRLGDWIRYDGKPGLVVAIRWRTTTVRTRNNEHVIIPNAQLVKERIHVLSRHDSADYGLREVPFSVAYDQPPSRVVAAVSEALRRVEIPLVSSVPAPVALCSAFGDSGIAYIALYAIVDQNRGRETDSEVMAVIYSALQRAGMRIPFPLREVHLFTESPPEEARQREIEARRQALGAIELFGALTDVERQTLAGELRPCLFTQGEVLFHQGDAADSLFVLTEGRLAVYDQTSGGPRTRLAMLEPPSYVGEMGLLTGQVRAATVVADTDVRCLRLDKAGFDAILRNRPQIVDELSELLTRRQAANEAMLQALGSREREGGERRATLVARIRRFFGL